MLTWTEGDQFPLIGKIKRVEAEQFADPSNRLADRDLLFLDLDSHLGSQGDLVERSGETTPGGVSHASDRGTDIKYPPDEIVQGSTIASEGLSKREPFSVGQDGCFMIAYGSTEQDAVIRLSLATGDLDPGPDPADSRSVDEELIPFTMLHHFGIARDDGDLGSLCGFLEGLDDPAERVDRQALLDNQRKAEMRRSGSNHGEIVYRSVDRQFPNVASGKEKGPNDIGVGCESKAALGCFDARAIVQGVEGRVRKRGEKHLLDKVMSPSPSTPMGQKDLLFNHRLLLIPTGGI